MGKRGKCKPKTTLMNSLLLKLQCSKSFLYEYDSTFQAFFLYSSTMIQIHTLRNEHTWRPLKEKIESFIISKKKVICFACSGKRPIYLDKYILAQENRHDKNTRLSLFFSGIELIRRAKPSDTRMHGETEWEICWILPDKRILAVHIREEKIGNDRILFLISTFDKT